MAWPSCGRRVCQLTKLPKNVVMVATNAGVGAAPQDRDGLVDAALLGEQMRQPPGGIPVAGGGEGAQVFGVDRVGEVVLEEGRGGTARRYRLGAACPDGGHRRGRSTVARAASRAASETWVSRNQVQV
jgi:hypothetical protein